MNNDLKALDFDIVQRLLEKLARTPYGAEAGRNLEPAPERALALRMQAAVTAARLSIDGGEVPRLEDVPQIQAALRQAAARGAALRPQALGHIVQVMRAARSLVPYVQRRPALYPGDSGDFSPHEALFRRLEVSITPAGNLRDDASPRLAELTAERLRRRAQAAEAVRSRLQRADAVPCTHDRDRVSWHGERAVVSIAQSCADIIKGVRHSASSGGRELVVEPLEAVAANNRIEAVAGEINIEQQRLLRELTDAVRAALPELERMIGALTWVDLAYAAGELSARLNGHAPNLAETPQIELHEAYHPLLLLQFADGTLTRPVPLTLRLDPSRAILVVTGPNTGGKTVALKTLGLLTAMARCGLHIPAEGDCTVGWYRTLMVDVGDRQSLYHHLSTFAGHVEVLKRILAEADAATLVLLDELGTGTDPEEGAALAMAVLDELTARGVQGIVNTHLSPLKEYAARHERLSNAAMVFDHATLKPTYRLEIGVTGASLGLLIAEHNGLPAPVVARARAHLEAMDGR